MNKSASRPCGTTTGWGCSGRHHHQRSQGRCYTKTYECIYESWLPQSGYELADNFDFEYYNDDFKDFAPDSVFYIYIPQKKP
ncbi:MAG: GyrI-like domain-containing protein [Chloroflexota bacterium]|nr:GyrI-like domain-containing protein [Chloroflexota bacterium]